MPTYDVVATLDGKTDEEKGEYEEFGGAFRKEIEVPDVAGLTNTLAAQKLSIKELKKAKSEMDERLARLDGIDPEAYTALLKEKTDREKADELAEKQRKLDAMTAAERESAILREKEEAVNASKVDLELTKKEAEAKELILKQTIDRMAMDNEAKDAALLAGVFPADIKDVLLVSGEFRKSGGDGKTIILGDSGEETELTLKEFYETKFKELKPKYYPPLTPGGGSETGDAGGGVKKFADYTESERVAIYKKDPAEYEKIRAAG